MGSSWSADQLIYNDGYRDREDRVIDYIFRLLDIPWWYYAIAVIIGITVGRWKRPSLGLLAGYILLILVETVLIRQPFKPMHMQPIYRTNPFVTVEGNGRGRTNAYIKGSGVDVGADIFRRGLCLPSDNKMTEEQQDWIIEIIHRCFK